MQPYTVVDVTHMGRIVQVGVVASVHVPAFAAVMSQLQCVFVSSSSTCVLFFLCTYARGTFLWVDSDSLSCSFSLQEETVRTMKEHAEYQRRIAAYEAAEVPLVTELCTVMLKGFNYVYCTCITPTPRLFNGVIAYPASC